jgi:hypothetical protein
MSPSLTLISAAVDGDRDALENALAIVDRSLGEALTSNDLAVSGAAAEATVAVLAVHDLLTGVLPAAATDAPWPLRPLLELLGSIAHGIGRLDVPAHRAGDLHAAVAHLRHAHAVLDDALT